MGNDNSENNCNNTENMVLNHQASQHSPSGRDDHDQYLDNHTADLDDLLGRRPSLVTTDTEAERTLVVWPPPSPLPPPEENRYPSPVFSPSPPPPMQVIPLPPRTPSPSPGPVIESVPDVPMPPLSPVPKKSNLKKRSQSEGTRRFSNSSLHEIDQQIVMIQNEFEAELDTLIDTYRNIQLTSRKTKGETVTDASMMAQTKTAAVTTTDCTANERSRRGKHVQTGHLSDEEGSYQALSVVFEDDNPAAPPRPPLPTDGYNTQAPPARPPPPPATLDTTDDESEDLFQHAPTASQGPIMMAAHDLHQEGKQSPRPQRMSLELLKSWRENARTNECEQLYYKC